jgi:uncharacterized protein YndB with AHSA1/START domain
MTSPVLNYVLDLPVPRDVVWSHWTDGVALQTWLCDRATVEPSVGGAYHLEWGDASVAGQVLSIDHPRLLVLSWPTSDQSTTSEVEVHLLPTLDGSRLELSHVGLEGEQAEVADRLWLRCLERLKLLPRRDGTNEVIGTAG